MTDRSKTLGALAIIVTFVLVAVGAWNRVDLLLDPVSRAIYFAHYTSGRMSSERVELAPQILQIGSDVSSIASELERAGYVAWTGLDPRHFTRDARPQAPFCSEEFVVVLESVDGKLTGAQGYAARVCV